MRKEDDFLIYCMERYRYYKNLSGKDVAKLFEKHGVYSTGSRHSSKNPER